MIIKSYLLNEEGIQIKIDELNKVKDYLIFAATGEVEKNDPVSLEHLKALVYLTDDLESLLTNLPFISVDLEKMSEA